jgi:hypothetical protein
MIVVDVYVPALDVTYNFSLDENACVGDLVDELVEVIERRTHVTFVGDSSAVALAVCARQEFLPRNHSLQECAVVPGSTLMLV